MKILFIARHFTYFRNYESAVAMLASRGHRIHLAAERGEELGGREMVDRLAAHHPEVTIGFIPDREEPWRSFAVRLRMTIDYLRYLDAAYSETPKLRARARERVPRAALWLLTLGGAWSTAGRRVLRTLFTACERAIPRSPAVDGFLRAQNPDVVLLTPLIGVVASPQLDYLQSAKALGYPTALCVWSWDHLSSKAIVRNVPDRLFVWNPTQRDEAVQLHGVPADRVVVTGAQCFDQWFGRTPTDRDAFCAKVGLPAGRPFLLYVCSALFQGSPSEARFVQRWIRGLRDSGIEPLASVPVLVRPHPARMKEWTDVDLSGEENVAVWGRNPVDADARSDYFDSLYHSAAVVGVNTSAFLEGAIAGRAVYAPLLPEFYENQEGTIHFHYLLTVGGGLLHTARALGDHFRQLNDAVVARSDSDRSRRFVEAFIRPHGRDVPATPRFADAVEQLASVARAAQPDEAWHIRLLRHALGPLASCAAWPAAAPLVSSERDRLIAARHRTRRAREESIKREKRERKEAQLREKHARVAARVRHKAERTAELRRAKMTRKLTRRIRQRIGLGR